ncbi:MAG: copper chaperone PCu(A)C [Betaproteobacteria bacterium]|nr:copper chaperone PCu(A)C [Betaproteobacteria bacterium]
MNLRTIALTLFASAALTAHAQPAGKTELKVFDVWARTTVPGASVSAAYMHIKSAKPMKLVKAESPVAGMTEIHQMSMKDGVMSMSAVDAVDIPAGKLVDLKPGGLHVMLMQLKQPIKKGDEVPLKLTFEDAAKKTIVLDVKAKAQEKDTHSHKH